MLGGDRSWTSPGHDREDAPPCPWAVLATRRVKLAAHGNRCTQDLLAVQLLPARRSSSEQDRRDASLIVGPQRAPDVCEPSQGANSCLESLRSLPASPEPLPSRRAPPTVRALNPAQTRPSRACRCAS